MAHIQTWGPLDLQNPVFIEGMPGIGLVGKIATDHVIEQLNMAYIGSIRCPGLSPVAIYREGSRNLLPPVRLYASTEHDLIALQSDVPISPITVSDFASCLTGWVSEHGALPILSSGRPAEVSEDEPRAVHGVTSGGAGSILDGLEVGLPVEDGIWSGPTGAVLYECVNAGLSAVGLFVESNPQSPDPEAACALLEEGIMPIAGLDLDVSRLRENAEEICERSEQFASRMYQSPNDESSKAEPMPMYH